MTFVASIAPIRLPLDRDNLTVLEVNSFLLGLVAYFRAYVRVELALQLTDTVSADEPGPYVTTHVYSLKGSIVCKDGLGVEDAACRVLRFASAL